MPCQCQSDRRTLALFHPQLRERYADLLTFAAGGWRFDAEAGAMLVPVGSREAMSSVTEVVNFLRGVVSPDRLAELRAAWIDGERPLTRQHCRLNQAERLVDLAPADSTPLLKILTERRIETWYQPVFRADSLDVWGYECLMRARAADGSLIFPGDLLKWARQEHLLFMLDRVCRETHLLNAGRVLGDTDCRILLNFLPTAIYQPEFCLKTTLAAARKGGIDFGRVIFEVVETERVHDVEHLRRILDYYRALGFGVALDDVGSGYAGLTMLADLNPDLIKLDRELLVKAVDSHLHRHVCFLLAQLARDTGKLILAEGVETPRQRDLAYALEVDLVQGYLFGRPQPEPVAAALAAI